VPLRPPLPVALPALAALLSALPRAGQEPGLAAGPPSALPPEEGELGAGAIPDEQLSLLFEGAFLGAENSVDFRETPGLRKLLEQLSRMEPAELAQRCEARFDYGRAIADPRAFQGRFFRCRGTLVDVETVRLGTPIFGQEDLYRAIVVQADGNVESKESPTLNEGTIVDMLERPPDLELRRAVVELEGIFFRTVRYENRSGEFKLAPYFVARRITSVDTKALKRRTELSVLGMILVGAAVAYGLFRLATILSRHRPRGSGPRPESLRARAEENRRRSMAQSKGPPPSSRSSGDRS
jgi:hypothetical protein